MRVVWRICMISYEFRTARIGFHGWRVCGTEGSWESLKARARKEERTMLFGKREDENGEVHVPLLAERHSFDDLAKGVASGTITRGRALKLAGAAILGGGLLSTFFSQEAEAGGRPKCPDSGPGCRAQCPGSDCGCVKTTEGKNRCVVPSCDGKRCRSSADCPSGQVCSTTARKCCGSRGPVCVPVCGGTNTRAGGARSADDGGWTNA